METFARFLFLVITAPTGSDRTKEGVTFWGVSEGGRGAHYCGDN